MTKRKPVGVRTLQRRIAELECQVKHWEDKEVNRASDCCGQQERAERAEARAQQAQDRVKGLEDTLRNFLNAIVATGAGDPVAKRALPEIVQIVSRMIV